MGTLLDRLHNLFRIIILISLVLLLIFLNKYELDSCDHCKFYDDQGKRVGISKFFQAYEDKCLVSNFDVLEYEKNKAQVEISSFFNSFNLSENPSN